MEFLVIAHDKTDADALARRMAIRDEHLEAARETIRSGAMLIGGAILDDAGRMVGSMTVLSMPDRAALDAWFRQVPYVRHGIWDRVEIHPFHVAVMQGRDGVQ
jgi:uncharacterized protein YciI